MESLDSFLASGETTSVEKCLYRQLGEIRPEIEDAIALQRARVAEILDQFVGAEPRNVPREVSTVP